jgi:hypothetical protein
MWLLLMWFAGYRFGTGDHVETLPYVLYLHNHALYAHDFFMQSLSGKTLNERTVIAYILLPFVNHLETACFLLEAIFTILLVLGMEKLGELLIGNVNVARVAIFINFIFFFDRGLGNVELYDDALQASNISVAFIAFGLYYFFKERYLAATIIMCIATIIHPIEGLTVFLAMFGTLFFYVCVLRSNRFDVLLKSGIIYGATAGLFIAALLSEKLDGVSSFSKQFDQETFFHIYHEFRLAHHFLLKYFPWNEKILFVVFTGITLFWGFQANKKFLWFNLVTLAGTLVYILGTDCLHLVDIANLQFYKLTQWTKFFAILILTAYAWQLIRASWMNPKVRYAFWGLVLIAAAGLYVVRPEFWLRKNVNHEFGFAWKEKSDIVSISMQIDRQIDKNAVFVQPFGCSELKFFGRVSSWVDFKAFPKNRGQVFEWYRRINQVYGISLSDKEKGFELNGKADNFFSNLSSENALKLKQEGVTHILSTNKSWPYGKLVLSNNTYAVYEL